MRKERLAYFKKRLIEKQRQLADEVGRTAIYGKDQEDDSIKDLGDQANTAYNREFFFELGNGDRRLLRDVVSALQKLGDGAFGSCQRCGGPTPGGGHALPADPPDAAEPPRRAARLPRAGGRGRGVAPGARPPAPYPRRRRRHRASAGDGMARRRVLRAWARGAHPRERER